VIIIIEMRRIEVSEDLLKVKNLVGEPRKIQVREVKEEIVIMLKELGHRVERLEKRLKEGKNDLNPKKEKQILFLLKQKPMTAKEAGKKLGISRTRANQYLRFLESQGILEGEIKEKKKYYKVKVIEK